MDISEYETPSQTAKRIGKSVKRVYQLINTGKIKGLILIKERYLIPKDYVPDNIDMRTVEGRRLKESYKMFVTDKKPKN